jgi:hypothetical protein
MDIKTHMSVLKRGDRDPITRVSGSRARLRR